MNGQQTTSAVCQNSQKTSNSKFAKRKQKRGKRTRSDGFVLGREFTNSSDEDAQDGSKPDADSLQFLMLVRNPTIQSLAKLRKTIKSNDRDWMKEFLEFDGLGLLFQCLKNLSSYQSTHLSDMVLRMECVTCIREVVNSQTGLDCLLNIKDRKDNLFGRRFASGECVLNTLPFLLYETK